MNSGTDGQTWIQTWARRIDALGLTPLALSFVEIARAFGSMGSHALLLAQPLLDGIVNETTLVQTMTLLDNPDLLERLRACLEEGEGD